MSITITNCTIIYGTNEGIQIAKFRKRKPIVRISNCYIRGAKGSGFATPKFTNDRQLIHNGKKP